MGRVKGLAIAVVALGAAGAGTWHVWLGPQLTFADMATAYGAKMVCSCRFVAERPMESCKTDFTVDVSDITFAESPGRIRASVLGGLVAAEAAFSPGLGCTLETP